MYRNNNLLATLILALFFQLPSAAASWFGYDSYDDCVREERLKRMDRWIGALNRADATVAARDVCEKYKATDPKYQKRTEEWSAATQRYLEEKEQREKEFQELLNKVVSPSLR